MAYFDQTVDVVLHNLHTSEKGLSKEEAHKRLLKYGKNILEHKKRVSAFTIFLSQFKDFLIWILIGAAVVSAVLHEYLDAAVIGVILVLNAALGFVQEYKAEKSIEALQKLASLKAVVVRDGKEHEIDATQLVPGDIVLLETGAKIPADCRLIEAYDMEIDEASLTGESLPQSKHVDKLKAKTALADQENMAFSGTAVTKGRGKAVVVSTAMKTALGNIAGLIQEAGTEETPLQKKLDKFGKKLGLLVIFVCVIVFFTGIMRGEALFVMLLAAISLAVAAVPEGLPAVVTITLALGVQRMVKRNALVRKLPSVETLGSTTVICSDKTGTLTHNQMTVKKIWVDDKEILVHGSGYDPTGRYEGTAKDLELLLTIGMLCNDSDVVKEKQNWMVVGDPTEAALVVSARKKGMKRAALEKSQPRVDEIPFSSERKCMTTIHKKSGKRVAYMKGSPEYVLPKCSKILLNGRAVTLTPAMKKKILAQNESFAERALRVLGFAYKPLNNSNKKDAEKAMIFVGLQAMIDPPRETAISAVEKCQHAGIKVVMITGDHIATASAIAEKLGITGKAITGQELEKMNDLGSQVENIAIYARVNPEHKSRIVAALKKNGHIVAMTGDGVNDAPALKKADIGVAMGIGGTDVAKEASDMILTDDNFASLVAAVEEGRTIFDNIQKFVEYLLSCNMGEVLTIFVALLIGLHLPLLAIMILWMNLITDGLPALALGLNPAEPGIMDTPPRKKRNILGKHGLLRMLLMGIVMMAGALFVFQLYEPETNLMYAQTMAFTILVMFQMFHVLNCRSLSKSLFTVGVFSNKYLWYAMGFSIGLQLIVVYVLNDLFKTVPLTLADWGVVLSVSASIFVVREIVKVFWKHETPEHAKC